MNLPNDGIHLSSIVFDISQKFHAFRASSISKTTESIIRYESFCYRISIGTGIYFELNYRKFASLNRIISWLIEWKIFCKWRVTIKKNTSNIRKTEANKKKVLVCRYKSAFLFHCPMEFSTGEDEWNHTICKWRRKKSVSYFVVTEISFSYCWHTHTINRSVCRNFMWTYREIVYTHITEKKQVKKQHWGHCCH